jgi:hypothetical protein
LWPWFSVRLEGGSHCQAQQLHSELTVCTVTEHLAAAPSPQRDELLATLTDTDVDALITACRADIRPAADAAFATLPPHLTGAPYATPQSPSSPRSPSTAPAASSTPRRRGHLCGTCVRTITGKPIPARGLALLVSATRLGDLGSRLDNGAVSLDVYRDDDRGHARWLSLWPGGYVLNIAATLNPRGRQSAHGQMLGHQDPRHRMRPRCTRQHHLRKPEPVQRHHRLGQDRDHLRISDLGLTAL